MYEIKGLIDWIDGFKSIVPVFGVFYKSSILNAQKLKPPKSKAEIQQAAMQVKVPTLDVKK
jgi:hypothetical protein